MPLQIIFENTHYIASAKPGMLIVERKHVEIGHHNRGRFVTGQKADEFANAFREEMAGPMPEVCAAFCRAILN